MIKYVHGDSLVSLVIPESLDAMTNAAVQTPMDAAETPRASRPIRSMPR